MVCDGDSKAYNSVWDVYGCCKTCEKYENINRQSKEHEKLVKSKAYAKWKKKNMEKKVLLCQRVKKSDCIGHVQKRLGTALRDYKRNPRKVERWQGSRWKRSQDYQTKLLTNCKNIMAKL